MIGTTTYVCDVCGREREGTAERLPTIACELRLERGDHTERRWQFCDPNCGLQGTLNIYLDRPLDTPVDLAAIRVASVVRRSP